MNFGKALEEMKNGEKVARDNWDSDQWVALLEPGANAQMTQPYIYIHKPSGDQVPWNPEHGELLGENWETR